MKLHELVPLDKRLHLFGEGPAFAGYVGIILWLAAHTDIPLTVVIGAAVGVLLFLAYNMARHDPVPSVKAVAFCAAIAGLYTVAVAYIGLQFNPGAAVIIGGIFGAIGTEIYQAVAHEGTADPMDAVFGSIVPIIAGIVVGVVL